MKHLLLKQNTTGIEIVTAKIIEKMYTLAKSEELDTSSTYEGNLQVTYTYEDSVSYLLGNKDDGTRRFPNLSINVTEGKYIRFEDPAVEKICATNWGDGTGITAAQAAAVSSIGTIFTNNTEITSFNEFKYFTNVTYLTGSNSAANPGAFYNCTLLQKIILPQSIINIKQGCFYSCSISYINLENIKTIESSCFSFCPLNMELNMPNLTGIFTGFAGTNITKIINLGYATSISGSGDYYHTYDAACGSCHYLTEVILPDTMTSITGFIDCTSLTTISFNNVTVIGDNTFQNCNKLKTIGNLSNIISIEASSFYNCSSLVYLKIENTVVPTLSNTNAFTKTTFNIYVPDESLSSYQSATNWSSYSSRIKSISQFYIDFPNS
jgi:hypothetical protein